MPSSPTVISQLLLLLGKIGSSDNSHIYLCLQLLQEFLHLRRCCLHHQREVMQLSHLSALGECSVNIKESNYFLGVCRHAY